MYLVNLASEYIKGVRESRKEEKRHIRVDRGLPVRALRIYVRIDTDILFIAAILAYTDSFQCSRVAGETYTYIPFTATQ